MNDTHNTLICAMLLVTALDRFIRVELRRHIQEVQLSRSITAIYDKTYQSSHDLK